MDVKRRPIQKIPTNIMGLDEVLGGGIPRGLTTVVTGGPGSGKTVLALEFLISSVMSGDPGVFVTFEERADAVRKNAFAMGWDVAPLEEIGRLAIVEARLSGKEVLAGDYDIQGLLAIIGGHIKRTNARMIVIDAIDVLLRIFGDPKRERDELYRLHDWLIDHKITTVLTVKSKSEFDSVSQYEFMDFMADCVICLDHRVVGQVATRRLRVIKYRGSGFGTNEYPYIINERGIVLIPLTRTDLVHKPLGPKDSSGLPDLDEMLDGGFRRASCVLVTGTSGTGKTTLACTFAQAACRRGERVLCLNFEVSEEALVAGMLSAGIDLRKGLKLKKLMVQTSLPEVMGSDGHLIRALDAIDAFKPDHVILDAASACLRMGSQHAAFDFLMRLVGVVKERGITCIMTNQINGGSGTDEELSGIGFSSVVDAVIQLRFVESNMEVDRQLLVLKSRGSAHSNRRWPFLITDQGIEFPNGSQSASAKSKSKLSRRNGDK